MTKEVTPEEFPAWYRPLADSDAPQDLAWPEPEPGSEPGAAQEGDVTQASDPDATAAPEPEAEPEPSFIPAPRPEEAALASPTPQVETAPLAIEPLIITRPDPQPPAPPPQSFATQPLVAPVAPPRPAGIQLSSGVVSGGPGWNIRETPSTAAPWQGADVTEFPPSHPSVPGYPPGAQPAPSRRTAFMRYGIFGAALFAVAGVTAVVTGDLGSQSRSISQPSSVGGLEQVSSPQLDSALQTIGAQQKSFGATDVVIGAYGTAGHPTMLVMVERNPLLKDANTETGRNGFMHGFVAGLSATGWTLDTSKEQTSSVSSATFTCAPMTTSQFQGLTVSTCVWTENGLAGVVMDLNGATLPDTLNEAVQARAAAEH